MAYPVLKHRLVNEYADRMTRFRMYPFAGWLTVVRLTALGILCA